MFLRPEPTTAEAGPVAASPLGMALPAGLAVLLSVVGTLLFGIVIPTTNGLTARIADATAIEPYRKPSPLLHGFPAPPTKQPTGEQAQLP